MKINLCLTKGTDLWAAELVSDKKAAETVYLY